MAKKKKLRRMFNAEIAALENELQELRRQLATARDEGYEEGKQYLRDAIKVHLGFPVE